MKSKTYIENLKLISQSLNFIDDLKNKSFFITGCNGLICSALVDLLIFLNKTNNLELKIFLATRNKEKTELRFDSSNKDFIKLINYDALKKLDFSENVNFFIHGASNATPSEYSKNPVETLMANVYGIQQILENAKNKKNRVLYISSSEVYGKLENQIESIKENQHGYVDILSSRSCYPVGKQASETLCASYNAEYGLDFVIVRPGHIYGPTASRNDNRVSSQFMYDALNGKNIIMKSNGEQLRSYTHCLDCATAILTVLVKGKSGEAYNIANPDSICSIQEMAKRISELGHVKLEFDIPSELEAKNFNPMKNSTLNSEKLKSLGWFPSFSLDDGFSKSMSVLKDVLDFNAF